MNSSRLLQVCPSASKPSLLSSMCSLHVNTANDDDDNDVLLPPLTGREDVLTHCSQLSLPQVVDQDNNAGPGTMALQCHHHHHPSPQQMNAAAAAAVAEFPPTDSCCFSGEQNFLQTGCNVIRGARSMPDLNNPAWNGDVVCCPETVPAALYTSAAGQPFQPVPLNAQENVAHWLEGVDAMMSAVKITTEQSPN